MKKIGIVYPYFAHYRRPVLQELCELLSNDYEIELLADEEAEIPALRMINLAEFSKGICSFQKLHNVWLGRWLWQFGLLRSVLCNKADAIIFLGQFNFISTWFAVLLAKFMGKKTLFWSHGVYGNESGLKRLIRVTFYRMADGMLLYGDYSKKLLIDLGMDPRSLEVIYNSLDYSKQKELRDLKSESCVTEVKARLFGSGDLMQPYLIFVGRLTSVKRLDLLLKAVAKLKQRGRAVNCLIVGEGPEAEMLYHLTESLGIVEQVNFYGASHDEEELSELIYSADLCVAPGNVGLTAMHALVYGTPVLTHGDKCWQMPEFEAIIAGVNGNFFERDDLDDLVDKAEALLKTCADDRSMMRTACYKIIDEKYNPSYQSQVIRQMINRR